MKKQNLILSAALVAVFSASTAFAEAEVTGKIVHESGFFSEAGTTIGADSATLNTTWTSVSNAHKKNDAMKSETSARIYIDGDIEELQEGTTYHVELNLMTDGEGVAKHDSNDSYTQRDALREAYVDTMVEDWSIRAGKQQVVWGTADGMKLLDMINPTDYSEMAQNQMEDSRIPVFMFNAEKTNEDGSEFQVVVSQPRENVFAGLDRNINTGVRENNADFSDNTSDAHSQGHAFMMKGVDSITGNKNGMLNIVPDLGGVARRFAWGFGGIGNLAGAGMENFTVDLFEGMDMDAMGVALGGASYANLPTNFKNAVDGVYNQMGTALGLSAAGEVTGAHMLAYGFAPYYNTNLADTDSVTDTTFDQMGSTTFKTFDAFVNAKSQYAYNMPSDSDVDLAMRYKNSTADGVNYSLNASYNYDKNPIINLSWRGKNNELLHTTGTTTLALNTEADGSGTAYGGAAQATDATLIPTLRFEQTVKRAKNIGGSFDMAIETKELGPVVIRGEALYQRDVYSPVFDKAKMTVGDLPGALTMVKGDKFKYVMGVDITALTNMLVSVQLIQERNLDFIDGVQASGRYTADYATMSLLNDFNKAEENKEFYSLFFSKPFGASGEHRWNNIFMFEENGGKWNRLDAEFSIDDDTQVTAEYNKYWGDANTQFGQLEKSSNVQVGFKYSF